MVETPLFFPRGSIDLFGVYHEAAGPGRLPFVLCHPFAEEKLWAHRVYVSFARALAARGHAVLRFDCLGCGDSGGSFADSTIQTTVEDVGAAIAQLRTLAGADR